MEPGPRNAYHQLGSGAPPWTMRGQPGQAPHDRASLVYVALVLCGAGFLLPYNSFITAVDYYQAKFPDTTIIFDMSLVYICVAFAGVLLNNLLVEQFSLSARITFGYVQAFVTLLTVALADVWFEVFDKRTAYNVNLIAVAAVAFGCTVQQSSFYGYTSMLPRRYTQAVMTGESLAGFLVSVNRIVTKALMHNGRLNTITFFALSLITEALCCVVFHLARRTRFSRYHVSRCEMAGVREDQHGLAGQDQLNHAEEVSLVDILDGAAGRDTYGVLVLRSPSTPIEEKLPSTPAATTPTADVSVQTRPYHVHLSRLDAVKRGIWLRWAASRHVAPYMLAIAAAYFVTLCLFPGIETEVVSCRLHSWMPIILIALMNLFDLIGKVIASIPYDWSPWRLLGCTLGRVILIPLMLACAAPRGDPYLHHEGWSMVLSAALGLSNGYFGSVPMILAPARVPDEQKEITGNLMTLSYSVGLTAGSICAYMLEAALGPRLHGDVCQLAANMTTNANVTDILHVLSDLTAMPGI